MNSTCLSYRAPLLFSFNDCSACLIDGFDRNPLLYSSSFSCLPCSSSCCCCCCAKSVSVSSCCNGLRQSNLIQWSPRKRLILNNVDRFSYRRRLLSGNDYVFRERKVGNGRFNRMVFEEMSEWDGGSNSSVSSSSNAGLDEVEAMLSLLAEVSDECKNAGETRARQSCRKKEVVERGSSSDRRQKKNVDSGVLESRVEVEYESKVMGSKGEGLRRKEDNRRGKGRIEDERGKPRRRDSNELAKEEKRMNLFVEDRRERSRLEETESSSAREDRKQVLRKDGSGGSSYYSASSADYEYDDEIQHDQGAYEEEILGGYLRDYGKSERFVSDEVKEDMRGKETRELDVVLRKETAKAGFSGASSSAVYDWRKKSEKKLSDSSVQEIKASEELLQNQFRSGKNVNVDEKSTKERNDQMIERERRIKSEQSNEILQSRATDAKTYSTTGKIYKGDNYKSQSSVQKESEYRIAHNQIRNEEDYSSSGKLTEESKLQEVENRVTSTSVRQSGVQIKSVEDYSNTNLSTSTKIEEKQHQSSQASGLLDSSRKYQQLTEELDSGSSSILRRKSDSRMEKHEINSSSSYKSQYNLRKEETSFASHETIGVSIAPYSNTIVSSVDDGHTRTGMVMEPLPQMAVGGPIRVELIEEVAGDRVLGSLTSSDKHTLDRSKGFHHQSSDDARQDDARQPSKFVSGEDRLASADLLQKSSLQHAGEFVEKAKNEISSSELPEVKETQEIKSVHEDEQRSKANLSSHSSQVSQTKERNSRSSSRSSATKGPSDQIWGVSEPSVQEPPEAEGQGSESTTDKVDVKETGKSLWNIIGDIVRLRWHSRSETNSSGAKSGGKNSPVQSTSDETWFSGRDHEENIDPNTKSGRISPVEKSTSSDHRHDGKVSSGSEGEVSNSSNSPDNRKQKRTISFPSSSPGVSEKYSAIKLLPSQSGEATSGVKESSVLLPSLELKMSPVEKKQKATEGEGSSSCTGSQTKIPTPTAEKAAFGGKSEESKRKKLGRSDQFEKDRFDEWEEAYRLESDQRRIDETFMREALLEAKKAADSWEVPVGAVLVKDGEIIARGYNLVEELRDSTAHAEINCIREASNVLRTWRLSETTLYVTLEPCPMCAGAIFQARIDAVVWGAPNKLLGADGSWIRLFPNGEGGNDIEPSNKPAAPVHPFHPNITVRRRVLESECADAMQQFFQLRRKKDKSPEPTTPPSGNQVTHHPSKFLSKMHHAFHILLCL